MGFYLYFIVLLSSVYLQGIDSELRLAAESFFEGDDGIWINMSKKEVHLTTILKWYREDFGRNNEEVILFIDTEKCSLDTGH